MNIEQFQIGDRVRINHHGWIKIIEMNPGIRRLQYGECEIQVLAPQIVNAVCTIVDLWFEHNLMSVKHPRDFTVYMAPDSLERVDNT